MHARLPIRSMPPAPPWARDVRRHLGGGLYLDDFVMQMTMDGIDATITMSGRSVDVFTADQHCAYYPFDMDVGVPPQGSGDLQSNLTIAIVKRTLTADVLTRTRATRSRRPPRA